MLKLPKNLSSPIFYYTILVITFFIPINLHIVSWLIGFFTVVWFVEMDFGEKIKNIIKNKMSILFAALFLIYLIGITYTDNIKFGWFDIGIKVSLLIFPVIFSSFDKSFLNNLKLTKLFNAYIFGCFIGSLICMINAGFLYYKDGFYLPNFYYTNLSILFHPSYFSMYLNFAIVIIAFNLIQNLEFSIQHSFKYYLLILFFSVIIILLSSKAGIISLLIISTVIIAYLIIVNKKYKESLILSLIIITILVALINIFPNSLDRFNDAKRLLLMKAYSNPQSEDETSGRILIWKTSLEVIKKHPLFGVGTGDVKDVLLKTYKELNIKSAFEKKLNAHNQYFQTFIATGVIGFIILFLGLLFPAIFAFRQKNLIYLMFLIIFSFNITVESMLEVQAGVIFYGFFNSLLYFTNIKINDNLLNT